MDSEHLEQHSEHNPIAGESLTKLALNNKIVEMRKNVRQSRVQSINKLIKEIRRLKSNKGTEEKISRNLKKVDRLTEQMAVMKKVNPDVVSKFALQNEKSLVEITNDVNESVENKALARLACHKSVHQKVVEFREKFPDWKKSLILLLESLGEKYKNKKQTPVISKKEARKLNSTRKNENSVSKEDLKVPNSHRATSIKSSSGLWTVATCESGNADNNDGEPVESEDNNDEADLFSDESLRLENSDEFPDKDSDFKEKRIKTFANVEKSKSKTNKSSSPNRNVKTESSTGIFLKENIANKCSASVPHDNFNDSSSKSDVQKLQVSNRNIEPESTTKSVSKKVMKRESNSVPFKSVDSNKEPENISNSSPEVAADSFFFTRDNKEYLSISAKPINDSEEFQVDHKEPRRIKPQSKSERFPSNRKQFQPKSNQSNSLGKRKNFDSTRGKPCDTKDAFAAPALHPSWIAKKKQSTIIQNSQFQGKKIKFDD